MHDLILKIGETRYLGDYRYSHCIRDPDGTIYLPGGQTTVDGNHMLADGSGIFGDELLTRPENAHFFRRGLFLTLKAEAHYQSPGMYQFKILRSTDNLKTILEETASLYIPEAGKIKTTTEPLAGLFFFGPGNIVEMPDGRLIASMYGSFEEDQISPNDTQSKRESLYKLRSFVIESKDEGLNWRYLSTVARPEEEDPIGEGFNESSILLLDNDELLCVMRTGHYSPLYSAWSSDGGRTWSKPVYTGLDRGCAPNLLKLSDGRIVLAYGQRWPAGELLPRFDEYVYPGRGLVKLAISPDGTGREWVDTTIGWEKGSCYTTIIETEPNILFCLADHWYWRVMILPKIPDNF